MHLRNATLHKCGCNIVVNIFGGIGYILESFCVNKGPLQCRLAPGPPIPMDRPWWNPMSRLATILSESTYTRALKFPLTSRTLMRFSSWSLYIAVSCPLPTTGPRGLSLPDLLQDTEPPAYSLGWCRWVDRRSAVESAACPPCRTPSPRRTRLDGAAETIVLVSTVAA
jgi:hypothetical protein